VRSELIVHLSMVRCTFLHSHALALNQSCVATESQLKSVTQNKTAGVPCQSRAA